MEPRLVGEGTGVQKRHEVDVQFDCEGIFAQTGDGSSGPLVRTGGWLFPPAAAGGLGVCPSAFPRPPSPVRPPPSAFRLPPWLLLPTGRSRWAWGVPLRLPVSAFPLPPSALRLCCYFPPAAADAAVATGVGPYLEGGQPIGKVEVDLHAAIGAGNRQGIPIERFPAVACLRGEPAAR